MRVSADIDDPGFENFRGHHDVFVDGCQVLDVVTADEEIGFVDVYERDENNRFIVVGGTVKTKQLHGVVKII